MQTIVFRRAAPNTAWKRSVDAKWPPDPLLKRVGAPTPESILRFNCRNLTSKCASLRFTCNRQQARKRLFSGHQPACLTNPERFVRHAGSIGRLSQGDSTDPRHSQSRSDYLPRQRRLRSCSGKRGVSSVRSMPARPV